MALHVTGNTLDFISSGTYTSSSVSQKADLTRFIEGNFFVNVTAVSGSDPTLVIVIEMSPDNGSTWYTHSTLTTITGTGKSIKAVTNFGNDVRISYTIGGTGSPSFTFTVKFVGKS